MPQFTLSLDADTAQRIRAKLDVFGGSIPSFAAGLARDVSKLPVAEIVRIRQEISARIKDYELAEQMHREKKAS